MTAADLFLLRYDAIHEGFVDELFAGLGDADVRRRPHGANSIAWLVWHATRVEDAALSRFVADRPQVLDEGDWNRRMGIERRDVGPGMTGAGVDGLSAAIDVIALRGYQRAVAARTRGLIAELPARSWEDPVAPELVRRRVAADGLLIEAGRWVEDFWADHRSVAWFLLQVGLLHPYGHAFDAMGTRGLLASSRD